MCGPSVAAASPAEGCGVRTAGGGAGSKRPLGFQLGYHAGRITTYALLGALLGLLGQAGAMAALSAPFSPDSVTRWLKLAGGVAMVAAGVVLLASSFRARGTRLPEPTRLLTDRPWFAKTTAELLRRGPRWGFALGMLMGLLLCAPLLPIEIAALATGYPLYGALTMLAFGLGTVPALAGFGAASGLLGVRARGAFATASGALVVGLGLIVVWQGIGLAAGA
jgi:sulfite exporter TauE/SafE